MLTLKKVKELVEAPSHAKRTPSPKMLFEEGIVLLRREFDQGSHLTVYNSGYVLFSAGKRNTVFHIHDCCGDYVHRAEKKQQDMTEHEKCLTNGTYERARESGTEQNYDMIDGCVNNVPNKPRRIGGRWCWIGCISSKQSGNRKSRLSSNSRSEVVEIKNPL